MWEEEFIRLWSLKRVTLGMCAIIHRACILCKTVKPGYRVCLGCLEKHRLRTAQTGPHGTCTARSACIPCVQQHYYELLLADAIAFGPLAEHKW